jgi:hypothetical protein
VPRIGDDDQHARGTAVTALEADPPFERLEVHQYRLRFNGDPPAGALDYCVPGTQVGVVGKGDLGAELKPGIEPRSKPIEEPLLASVADGVAPREDADCEVEPDYSAPGGDVIEPGCPQSTALEPKDLLVRRVARGRYDPTAEAGPDPRRSKLSTDTTERLVGSATSTVRRSLASRHS